ncbi:MAG: YtxH domain-containing protein [Coriobacteriia bacterium]|nr:YtxH domain-containing protein [Coriobacteriia bacterium]
MGKVTSFLFGGAVGVVVGVLIAPRSGEETRALVADKVDEYWGKGAEFYTKGVTRVQTGVSGFQPNANVTQRSDELREKIESARSLIADQVVKNAATARDAINDRIPIAAEKVSSVVDAARSQIDSAASALKNRATELSDESAELAEANAAAEGEEPGAVVIVFDTEDDSTAVIEPEDAVAPAPAVPAPVIPAVGSAAPDAPVPAFPSIPLVEPEAPAADAPPAPAPAC